MALSLSHSLDEALKQNLENSYDVVVIGAGPAGSVAAIAMARRGRSVLLVERSAWPRAKTCGGCLSGAAIGALETLDLGDLPRACGATPLHRLHLRLHGATCELPWIGGVALSRSTLDRSLVDAAIEAGARFSSETTARLGQTEEAARIVELKGADGACHEVRARIVLAADGLAGSSMREAPDPRIAVSKGSHIGVGCVVRDPGHRPPAHCLEMIADREGYLGIVQVEDGDVCLAAALSPASIQRAGGLRNLLSDMLESIGYQEMLAHADCKGVPELTRRRTPPASNRVLILGDAAAYVEPLTGEGIGWAMWSALAAAPLADDAVDTWTPDIAARWRRRHARLFRHRYRVCRLMSLAVRRPTLSRSAVRLLSVYPSLIAHIADWRQASPDAEYEWNPA